MRAVPRVAVIVATVFAGTALVVTVKVAVVAFAATVMLAGTCTAALLLDKVTTAPPAAAFPFSVTVPVDGVPPRTETGLRATEFTLAAITVRLAVRVVPSMAVIVSGTSAATVLVVIVNVAVVAPAVTVTLPAPARRIVTRQRHHRTSGWRRCIQSDGTCR